MSCDNGNKRIQRTKNVDNGPWNKEITTGPYTYTPSPLTNGTKPRLSAEPHVKVQYIMVKRQYQGSSGKQFILFVIERQHGKHCQCFRVLRVVYFFSPILQTEQ